MRGSGLICGKGVSVILICMVVIGCSVVVKAERRMKMAFNIGHIVKETWQAMLI
jgi:hypothetical protein